MLRSCKWMLWCVVDILCLSLAFLPSLILHGGQPYQRKVECADRSIQKPTLKGTINNEAWIAINFIPAAAFGLGELFTNWSHFNQSFYKIATIFMIGSLASNSLTYLAKFFTGHLRPDLLDVCNLLVKPDNGVQQGKSRVYWYCQEDPPPCWGHGQSPDHLKETRLSFYSFHSSHVMYYMVFIALYFEARMQGRAWMRLLRPTIQFNLLLLAVWVGYTRVFDNKSFLNDVLMGLLQGAFLAIIFVRLSPELFKLPEDPAEGNEKRT